MADVQFDIEPLREGWRRATEEIKRDVQALAVQHANAAAARIVQAYPLGPTGHLRSSVFTSAPTRFRVISGEAFLGWRVLAGHPFAPHIHFIEGCRDGYGRAGTKKVPARPTLIPIAIDERAAYYRDAQASVDRDRQVV